MPYTSSQFVAFSELHGRASCLVLQDFGRNWQNLTENSKGKIAAFWDFDWGAKVHWGDKDMSDETILATVYDKPEAMKGPYPAWDKDIHFVRSDDLFVKHDKLVACGNQIEVLAGKVGSCEVHDFA